MGGAALASHEKSPFCLADGPLSFSVRFRLEYIYFRTR